MLKRRPQGSGAVQLGGEQPDLSPNRPKLQANWAMRLRLDLILWSRKAGGARHG
jgi:hypothetical protein